MNKRSAENPFAPAFRTSTAGLVLLLAASLCFILPPLMVFVPLAGAAYLWAMFRHPIGVLGALLAFMPIDYLAIELGKFFGLPYMTVVSACTKEVPLLLLMFILWHRNGFKPVATDWFLMAVCALATVHTVFNGIWAALAIDSNFVIPYFVGRMTVLKEEQEQKWAIRAVWIVGILAILGLTEVFIFGEGPRTVLYLATDSMTDNGGLTGSFFATGFEGMREAATMAGPPSFGALCMIALIIWWVYCRNPLPAIMIGVGLVCSVTRAAWLGATVALPLLGFVMDQKKRFFLYATLGLALLGVSIPILGLGDFIFLSKTGQDPSAEGHQDTIMNGLNYVVEHPFGSGNEKVGPVAWGRDKNAPVFETTYPALAAKYGILAVMCFVGFLLGALNRAWRQRTPLAYAAVGILVSVALVMVVTLPLDDRRLACWALFPIGLAVRSSISRSRPFPCGADRNADG
jgi:hypothetical protein